MHTDTYTFTYIDTYLCKTDLARDRKVNALFFFIHSADLAGGGGGRRTPFCFVRYFADLARKVNATVCCHSLLCQRRVERLHCSHH